MHESKGRRKVYLPKVILGEFLGRLKRGCWQVELITLPNYSWVNQRVQHNFTVLLCLGLWLTIRTTPPIYTQFLFLLRSPSSTFQSIIRIVYTSYHENFPFAADSPTVRLLATFRNASVGPRETQLCIQFVRTIPHDSWISFSRRPRRWPKRSDRKSLEAHHIELLIQLMIPPGPPRSSHKFVSIKHQTWIPKKCAMKIPNGSFSPRQSALFHCW